MMDEDTRQVLLGITKVLDEQEKRITMMRHSVDRLLDRYADGDERILRAVRESEDQVRIESLDNGVRKQVDAIIGILQRAKSQG
jgi:hypothetical protein